MTNDTPRFVISYIADDTRRERFNDSVSHIADTQQTTEAGTSRFLSGEMKKHRIRQEQLMCSRGSWHGDTDLSIEEAADIFGFEPAEFSGGAPSAVCSYCWENVKDELERDMELEEAGATEQIGNVGYRLRWKQKGRATDEWYDIVVRPETTMQEIDDLLLSYFSTLDNIHVRLYGVVGDSGSQELEILPDYQYDQAGIPSQTKASNITIGEVAEHGDVWEGDRLTMDYDLATPSRYYALVKEVIQPDEIDNRIADAEVIDDADTAAIVRAKRP